MNHITQPFINLTTANAELITRFAQSPEVAELANAGAQKYFELAQKSFGRIAASDAYAALVRRLSQNYSTENVGNLVCPATFDLGEHLKVVLLSVAEGEEKPLKYPPIFQGAHSVCINKLDLLPYVDFDMKQCRDNLKRICPQAKVFEFSCKTGEGLSQWHAGSMTSGRLCLKHHVKEIQSADKRNCAGGGFPPLCFFSG